MFNFFSKEAPQSTTSSSSRDENIETKHLKPDGSKRGWRPKKVTKQEKRIAIRTFKIIGAIVSGEEVTGKPVKADVLDSTAVTNIRPLRTKESDAIANSKNTTSRLNALPPRIPVSSEEKINLAKMAASVKKILGGK